MGFLPKEGCYSRGTGQEHPHLPRQRSALLNFKELRPCVIVPEGQLRTFWLGVEKACLATPHPISRILGYQLRRIWPLTSDTVLPVVAFGSPGIRLLPGMGRAGLPLTLSPCSRHLRPCAFGPGWLYWVSHAACFPTLTAEGGKGRKPRPGSYAGDSQVSCAKSSPALSTAMER